MLPEDPREVIFITQCDEFATYWITGGEEEPVNKAIRPYKSIKIPLTCKRKKRKEECNNQHAFKKIAEPKKERKRLFCGMMIISWVKIV